MCPSVISSDVKHQGEIQKTINSPHTVATCDTNVTVVKEKNGPLAKEKIASDFYAVMENGKKLVTNGKLRMALSPCNG